MKVAPTCIRTTLFQYGHFDEAQKQIMILVGQAMKAGKPSLAHIPNAIAFPQKCPAKLKWMEAVEELAPQAEEKDKVSAHVIGDGYNRANMLRWFAKFRKESLEDTTNSIKDWKQKGTELKNEIGRIKQRGYSKNHAAKIKAKGGEKTNCAVSILCDAYSV